MTNEEIIERIMTDHWDMAACPCWVCVEGRANGLHPQGRYLRHRQAPEDRRPKVRVDAEPR